MILHVGEHPSVWFVLVVEGVKFFHRVPESVRDLTHLTHVHQRHRWSARLAMITVDEYLLA